METTRLSSKGQIILPKAVRDQRHWDTDVSVEDTGDGILLRPIEKGRDSRLEDVAGCLKRNGPARTLKEMDAAIDAEVKARRDRGRYNIVIRFLMDVDDRQSERAVNVFRRETIFIAKSVVLEAEWVLRRGYREKPARVADALVSLIVLANITCEDEAEVRQALAWHQSGMNLADALHLAASPGSTEFITFDRDMIKIGKRLGLALSTL